MPSIFSSVLFLYNPNSSNVTRDSSCSNFLQKSLSQTLVHFYPFAGKVNDESASIDCNDQGAHFIEAQSNFQLLDFLKQPDTNSLSQFNPTSDPESFKYAQANKAVLLVQLTEFNCGRIAIGVSVSHKIADTSTLCTFMQTWAAVARECEVKVVPEFDIGPSLLPSLVNMPMADRDLCTAPDETLVSKRFVFDFSRLASLKADLRGKIQLCPTNVVLATAILHRCVTAAYCSANGGSSKVSVLIHTLNLRKRMVPPVPENAVGNIIWGEPLFVDQSGEMKLDEIVVKITNGLTEFYNEKANRLKGEEGYSFVYETFELEKELVKVGFNVYSFTSWCKFPFYEMDFGWGKPIWVASGMFLKNIFIFLDSNLGDGIEVWLTLEEKHMAMLEKDAELLAFASCNPSIVIDN